MVIALSMVIGAGLGLLIARGRRAARSANDSPAATANPSVVTRPVVLPACSVASGIIESTSITIRAPAAKPLMPACSSSEAMSAIP